MDSYDQLNEILVYLFNHTMDIEQRFLASDEFKDISVNDMHIIDAIGIRTSVNMSALAKKVGVTVGTLTIAINGLVRKGYVSRRRSASDKRVVLISLLKKGEAAFNRHSEFHHQIAQAVREGLSDEECRVLITGLSSLKEHFDRI